MPQAAFYTQLPAPRTLVDGIFEGGGTGGIVYVGAVMALARHGVWFKRTAGTSAGSIMAATIAAGYDANECDYLAAPSGAREGAPGLLPADAEPLGYRSLLDLPSSPDDVTLESRRNNLLYYAISGAAVDELLKIPVSLPSLEPFTTRIADRVLAALPSQIGPLKLKVGPFKVKAGPLVVDTDRYEVEVGPFPVPLTDLKPLVQNAVAGVLQAYPHSMKLDEAGVLTGDQRQGFADAVMSTLMTAFPFLNIYLHFLGDGGLFKGEAFLQAMRRMLEVKVGRHPVRFIDLPMEFACAASNATSHVLEVYSTKTTPEMEVAEAVRRSMSIPFFFAPRRENRHEIMDGSIIDNAPAGFYLVRDNGYFENSTEDMQRVKIGFRPGGAGLGPAVDVEQLLAQRMPAGGLIPTNTVEVACLKRALNIAVTSLQESPLFGAMLRELKDVAKVYEISGELDDHSPVDFDITPDKFSRLCSKGWQGAIRQIKEGVDDGNLTLAAPLNNVNPYQ